MHLVHRSQPLYHIRSDDVVGLRTYRSKNERGSGRARAVEAAAAISAHERAAAANFAAFVVLLGGITVATFYAVATSMKDARNQGHDHANPAAD
jgi:hypothetical protein